MSTDPSRQVTVSSFDYSMPFNLDYVRTRHTVSKVILTAKLKLRKSKLKDASRYNKLSATVQGTSVGLAAISDLGKY